MSTMGLPVPVDLRHCTILPGIAPTYVLRCPAHIVLPLVRLLHAFPSSRGGGGGGRGLGQISGSQKDPGDVPLGVGGSLVSHVHAEEMCKGHDSGLTGYKYFFTEREPGWLEMLHVAHTMPPSLDTQQ